MHIDEDTDDVYPRGSVFICFQGDPFMSNSKNILLIFAALPFLAGLGVILLTPSPLYLLHRLDATEILPPLWILTILLLGWYAAAGVFLGGAFLRTPKGRASEGSFWRGCTCLVLGCMLLSVWYILLFGKGTLLLSWVFLPLCTGAMLMAVLSLHPLRGFSLWPAVPTVLWPIFLAILHLLVLLQT